MQIICTEVAENWILRMSTFRGAPAAHCKPTILTVFLENHVSGGSDANELGHT